MEKFGNVIWNRGGFYSIELLGIDFRGRDMGISIARFYLLDGR